jgi:hypothetical protein
MCWQLQVTTASWVDDLQWTCAVKQVIGLQERLRLFQVQLRHVLCHAQDTVNEWGCKKPHTDRMMSESSKQKRERDKLVWWHLKLIRHQAYPLPSPSSYPKRLFCLGGSVKGIVQPELHTLQNDNKKKSCCKMFGFNVTLSWGKHMESARQKHSKLRTRSTSQIQT